MMKIKKAFTLIELLVVIAIIAVLMSIMMPALGKARAQGQRIICGANQKQIASASNLYAQDYDGMLVQDRGFRKNSSGAVTYTMGVKQAQKPWDAAFAGMMSTEQRDAMKKWLVCPFDKKPRGKNNLSSDPTWFQGSGFLPRSYGLNMSLWNGIHWEYSGRTSNPELAGDRSCIPAKIQRVDRPNVVILVGDVHIGAAQDTSGNTGNTQGGNRGDAFEKPLVHTALRGGVPMCKPEQTTLHKDGGNNAFIDGHVEWHGLVAGENYDTGQPFKDLRYPFNWRWQKNKEYNLFQ